MRKTGILLVNLGTPDSPAVKDVHKYLAEFLSDERVIDINAFSRFLLVRGLIVPFRSPKSAASYSDIWSENFGSPLMHYSLLQKKLLAEALGNGYRVELAMRYQKPTLSSALEKLKNACVSQIIVLPMFPQYAEATTGSVIAKVKELTRRWSEKIPLTFINDFHDHDQIIESFANKGKPYLQQEFDHVLFSFHGLPQRQLVKCDKSGTCLQSSACCSNFTALNQNCYSAQAYHMARLIADHMGLRAGDFTISFQSRLGKTAWIQPYTSDVLKDLVKAGKRRILVFCPSFVTDCLETLHEIGIEYNHRFIANGGVQLKLVEGLNDDPLFIAALREVILDQSQKALIKEDDIEPALIQQG